MPTITQKMDIENEILDKVLSGVYTLEGGVVRDKKGKIVKFLKNAKAKKQITDTIIKLAKTHPKSAIIIGSTTLLSGGIYAGIAIKNTLKNRTLIKLFHNELNEYLSSEITDIDSEIKALDRILEILDELEQHQISIKISSDDAFHLIYRFMKVYKKLDIQHESNEDSYIEDSFEENPNELLRKNIVLYKYNLKAVSY